MADTPTSSAPTASATAPVDEVYPDNLAQRAQQVSKHFGSLSLTNQQKNFWIDHPNQCTYYEDAAYQTKADDTLASVANHFKRGSEQLRWYNGIARNAKIKPGQVIYSPNRYFMVPFGE